MRPPGLARADLPGRGSARRACRLVQRDGTSCRRRRIVSGTSIPRPGTALGHACGVKSPKRGVHRRTKILSPLSDHLVGFHRLPAVAAAPDISRYPSKFGPMAPVPRPPARPPTPEERDPVGRHGRGDDGQGEIRAGPADDARQRCCGWRAAYRVVLGLPAPGRARSRRASHPLRSSDDRA
jgi:hypothetical protein